MTDMQELPPNAGEDALSAQPQPTESQPVPLSLPHSQGVPGEEPDDSFPQSAFKTAGIRGLLPNALAKEERNARLNESRAKRRLGTPLTAEEVRDDLTKIISHLITQLGTHTAGFSIILKMPAQALLYVERTTHYAINDYPRVFENDAAIISLWDGLERMYIAAVDWRKDANKGDGKAVIGAIERIAKSAIRGAESQAEDAVSDDPKASTPDS